VIKIFLGMQLYLIKIAKTTNAFDLENRHILYVFSASVIVLIRLLTIYYSYYWCIETAFDLVFLNLTIIREAYVYVICCGDRYVPYRI